MTEPYVSVVIGVYNMEAFVGATLRSVVNQTYRNFEVIVVDDGSTDRTANAVEAVEDARIRLVRLSHQGSASARNHALSLARGKLLAFLDGDDLWDPVKLETHVAIFDARPEIDLTFDLVRHIDQNGTDLGYRMQPPTVPPTFENLAIYNMIACGSVTVARKQAIAKTDGFCPELKACIDADLWLRLSLLRPNNTVCIPEIMTSYRRHAGQITGKWRTMAQAWEVMLKRFEKVVPDRVSQVRLLAGPNHYRGLAALAHEQNDRLSSWRFLIKAFNSNPSSSMATSDFRRLLLTMTIRLFLPSRLHRALRRTIYGQAPT